MSLHEAIAAHLGTLAARHFARSTIDSRATLLRAFACWGVATGLETTAQLSGDVLANYRAHLASPARGLTLRVQRNHLAALRALGAWLLAAGRLPADPAAGLALPRLPQRLPQSVLSVREAERVLRRPRLDTPLGERDRAILELLYSSGLRRAELLALDVTDLDLDRQMLYIRRGKGGKARLAPIGPRAIGWLRHYLDGARLALRRDGNPVALFIGVRGTRLTRSRLNERLRRYLDEALVAKRGSCHVWRHTMATVMHDRGADIRDLQLLLGHAQLSTTAIYTHVSVERMLRVHRRTHPAGRLTAAAAIDSIQC